MNVGCVEEIVGSDPTVMDKFRLLLNGNINTDEANFIMNPIYIALQF